MSTVHPVSNPCYNIFILPFQEGGYNIRDAFKGTKINLVAQSNLPGPGPAPAEKQLSLGERVSAFVIGMILITPIVNMIAMAILRNAKNDFLHPQTVTNPNPTPPPQGPNPPPPPPPPPPLTPQQQQMVQRKENALERLETIEAIIAAEGHADPFPSIANQHFRCHPRLAQFDLNAFLDANYPTNAHPIGLYEFRLWAAVDQDGTWQDNSEALELLWGRRNQNENYLTPVNRDNYHTRREEWFVRQMNTICTPEAGEPPQLQEVRGLLRNTLAYFTQGGASSDEEHARIYRERARINQERAGVAPGSPEEIALNDQEIALNNAETEHDNKDRARKEQFQKFYNMFIDATHYCVDQVLSQMEIFVVDEIALKTNDTLQGPDAAYHKVFNQTCLALSKHRRELLTAILHEQDMARAMRGAREEAVRRGLDPERQAAQFVTDFQEQEMADVQRMATKEMAQHYGLQGRLVNAGAAFWEGDPVRRARAHEAVEAFKLQYKPEEYLIAGLMAAPAGDPRAAAHTFLQIWCKQHFALDAEYPEDPNYQADGPRMDDRLADPDYGMGISIGGAFTPASVTLVMEAAGLIEPRAPQV